jgi:hypothetical protein
LVSDALSEEEDYKLKDLAGFVLVVLGALTAYGVVNNPDWTVWNFVPKIIAVVVDLWTVAVGALILIPEGKSKQRSIDALLELWAAILGWLTDRIGRRPSERELVPETEHK